MRIGVDLGGTKIEAIALAEDGETLARRRTATPVGDYAGTLLAVASLVFELERELGASASVGVGSPGSLSKQSGRLRNSNSTVLNGRALLDDLSAELQRPVRLANDADCFALSEATDGAGAGANVVFGVILGTGVGGGIVVGGRLVQGHGGIAGEWGHNPLPWLDADDLPAPACYCGKHGCIETYLCGPGLSRAFEQRTGRTFVASDVTQRAREGDPDAMAALAEYEDRLARGLAHVVNILDPDVIVLGGGLSNVARLFENVPRLILRYVFSDAFETPVVPAKHGDSSGVRGAAWLWPNEGRAVDLNSHFT